MTLITEMEKRKYFLRHVEGNISKALWLMGLDRWEKEDTDALSLGDKVKVVSLQKKTLVWKRMDQDDTFYLRYVKLKMPISQSTNE